MNNENKSVVGAELRKTLLTMTPLTASLKPQKLQKTKYVPYSKKGRIRIFPGIVGKTFKLIKIAVPIVGACLVFSFPLSLVKLLENPSDSIATAVTIGGLIGGASLIVGSYITSENAKKR